MTADVHDIIRHLRLEPHPEGGYYRETYRSPGVIPHTALPPVFKGARAYATAIYFLLEAGGFSAFHRLQSDECWHFYQGVALNIYVLEPAGGLTVIRVGADLANGDVFQAVVPGGRWFASRPAEPEGYALVGCTVAPGFDFADFEMASAQALIQQALIHEFPQHEALIRALCRQ